MYACLHVSIREASTTALTHYEIFVENNARITVNGYRQPRVEIGGVEPPILQPVVLACGSLHQLALKLLSVPAFSTEDFDQGLSVGKVFFVDERFDAPAGRRGGKVSLKRMSTQMLPPTSLVNSVKFHNVYLKYLSKLRCRGGIGSFGSTWLIDRVCWTKQLGAPSAVDAAPGRNDASPKRRHN